MSAQFQSSSSTNADGTRTYIDRHGDTVQESAGSTLIYRGLAAAGGDGFRSESEESGSEEEYHHHPQGTVYLPQGSEKKSKSKKEKKEKKEKKSKKTRSGSSSSGHACTCSHSH
ncbi:hypothetical protein TWF481_006006 [Arthrobotrys musiformis]|uniref:Uncharacterized protein n=1 Tax=Arthrobotrys musiformis TaxID=47236 RepID=A0AAV9WHG3_9PEZI